MDHNEKNAALHNVFVRVLEEQMFLFADDIPLKELTFPDDMLILNIIYHGDADGGISLSLPLSLCREITASVLGVDESEIDETRDPADAAKELLNITCGQYLTDVYGDKMVMNLYPPTAESTIPEDFAAYIDQFACLSFIVDGHPVLLALTN